MASLSGGSLRCIESRSGSRLAWAGVRWAGLDVGPYARACISIYIYIIYLCIYIYIYGPPPPMIHRPPENTVNTDENKPFRMIGFWTLPILGSILLNVIGIL